MFGAKENLIRLLKDHDSLERIFEFQNLDFVVSDTAIDNIFRPKTSREYLQAQETMDRIIFKEIPQILIDEKGVDISSGVRGKIVLMPVIQKKIGKRSTTKDLRYYQETPEGNKFKVEFCIIYRNHIVSTQGLYKSLNRVFNDLRKMLS